MKLHCLKRTLSKYAEFTFGLRETLSQAEGVDMHGTSGSNMHAYILRYHQNAIRLQTYHDVQTPIAPGQSRQCCDRHLVHVSIQVCTGLSFVHSSLMGTMQHIAATIDRCLQLHVISPDETFEIRPVARVEGLWPEEQDAPQSHLWTPARCE